jgi:putative transposase
MVNYIDEHREVYGVEPICAVLPIASSTYYDNKKRPPSVRALRDAVMMPILLALFTANYSVYGVRKLWVAATRAVHDIGRDQVGRLMGQLGIGGVSRRRKVRTTIRDEDTEQPEDLVDRDFTADAPNQLWVTDLERHEAPLNRVVMKGHHGGPVAAGL